MKTLSIRSQYAYQVCLGIKDIENRSWKTPHRGKLLIHASGKKSAHELLHNFWPDAVLKDLKSRKFVIDHVLQDNAPEHIKKIYHVYYDIILPSYDCKTMEEFTERLPRFTIPMFITQAIIGEVTLSDIVVNHKSIFAEKNQYNWILTDPVIYDIPITEVKGKLRLWEFNTGG